MAVCSSVPGNFPPEAWRRTKAHVVRYMHVQTGLVRGVAWFHARGRVIWNASWRCRAPITRIWRQRRDQSLQKVLNSCWDEKAENCKGRVPWFTHTLVRWSRQSSIAEFAVIATSQQANILDIHHGWTFTSSLPAPVGGVRNWDYRYTCIHVYMVDLVASMCTYLGSATSSSFRF